MFSRIAPYFFISPFLALFLVFGLFPIVFSIFLMFHFWDPVEGIESMQYVGLENIQFAVEDPWLWTSFYNTVWLAIASGLPQHLVAIPLAWVINEHLTRTRNLTMGVYFLPYITSTVAIAMMFSAIFSTDYGLVNAMLQQLSQWSIIGHLFPDENIDWLDNAATIKPVLAMIIFWRFVGFNLILYVAALQAIPRDLYEAARVDGVSEWRIFFGITIPQLKPMIFFGTILSLIGGLQIFEEPFIITGGSGGVEQAGLTTALYMFRTAFEFNDFGMASTISWMLFVVIAVLTYLTNRAFNRPS